MCIVLYLVSVWSQPPCWVCHRLQMGVKVAQGHTGGSGDDPVSIALLLLDPEVPALLARKGASKQGYGE